MSDETSGAPGQSAEPSLPKPENGEGSLPPIPDGGLATSMPGWLRQSPARPVTSEAAEPLIPAELAGSLELPSWLSALSQRIEAAKPAPTEPLVAAATTVDALGDVSLHAPEATQPEPVTSETDVEAPAESGTEATPDGVAAVEPMADETAPAEPIVAAPRPADTVPDGDPVPKVVTSAEPTPRFAEQVPNPELPRPTTPVVDAATFLRSGDVPPVPEPRSKMPFIIGAIVVLVIIALVIWMIGI